MSISWQLIGLNFKKKIMKHTLIILLTLFTLNLSSQNTLYCVGKHGGISVITGNTTLTLPSGAKEITKSEYEELQNAAQAEAERVQQEREEKYKADRKVAINELLASGLSARKIELLGGYTKDEIKAARNPDSKKKKRFQFQ